MRLYAVFLIFLFCVGKLTEGKTFKNCELARALAAEGVPRLLLSNFVCLANAVSGLNTTKFNKVTPTTSNFGIFQISTEYCGQNGKPGGKCNIKCDKLVDDLIKDDIQCAKKIQDTQGFKHWNRWNERCKSTNPIEFARNLPNLHNCFPPK